MKASTLLSAILWVACGATLSFGQGFIACLYSADQDANPVPLYRECNGSGGYMPDGTVISIWWDQNANGPDPSDIQPPVGQDAGDVNFNTFTINSGMGVPGTFATDPCFVSVGLLPPWPWYYLRIACPSGQIEYTSETFYLSSGPHDVYISSWTCQPCYPCCLTPDVLFYGDQIGNSSCAETVTGFLTTLRVCPVPGGPPLDPTLPPVVTVQPGCNQNCNYSCQPGQFIYDAAAWTYNPLSGCWTNVITGQTDGGCYCVTFERFLPVTFNHDFIATGLDGAVRLTWSTASESDLLQFELSRDGATIGHVPATNTPAGHPYVFTDAGVSNGTTYHYLLRVVNTDNSVAELAEAEATPRAAVITHYVLHPNYPNPFNPTTQISYDLKEAGNVTLRVFNLAGQEVALLVNREEDAGRHTATFDGTTLSSGLYFCRLDINGFSATQKMLLVK